MTHDELKTLFKYWGDRKRLKEKIESVKARRKRFEDERDKAIELKGKVFYQLYIQDVPIDSRQLGDPVTPPS